MIFVVWVEFENLILEVVFGFFVWCCGKVLVVLGKYGEDNVYYWVVRVVVSDEVCFFGVIYDKFVV